MYFLFQIIKIDGIFVKNAQKRNKLVFYCFVFLLFYFRVIFFIDLIVAVLVNPLRRIEGPVALFPAIAVYFVIVHGKHIFNNNINC